MLFSSISFPWHLWQIAINTSESNNRNLLPPNSGDQKPETNVFSWKLLREAVRMQWSNVHVPPSMLGYRQGLASVAAAAFLPPLPRTSLRCLCLFDWIGVPVWKLPLLIKTAVIGFDIIPKFSRILSWGLQIIVSENTLSVSFWSDMKS